MNEKKKEPFWKYGSLQEHFCWRGVTRTFLLKEGEGGVIFNRELEIFHRKVGLTRKGWRKKEGGGLWLTKKLILWRLITKIYQICYTEKNSKSLWAIFWLWKQMFFEILKLYCGKLFLFLFLLSLLWTQLYQLKWPTVSNSSSIATLVNLTFISFLTYIFQYCNRSVEICGMGPII